MELSWFESLVFGLFSGLADVLPVSAQAHKAILMKIFGASGEHPLMRLVIHLAILAALYYSCSNQIMRIARQRKLAKIPKKKRKRPVDARTLMEFRLLCTMSVPVVISLFLYEKTSGWGERLNLTALFLLLNAVVLYLPNLMPTGNKDARSMSGLEGLMMGLGGAASVLPGVSSVGCSTAVASVCGADRPFALNLTYLMHMVLTVGLIVLDLITLAEVGLSAMSLSVIICCLLAAAAAFAGAFFGIRVMRMMAVNIGYSVFSYYCLGAALLSFVLYLMV